MIMVWGRDSGVEGSTVMLFIVSLNFTDQGIRNIKDAPKRAQAARELAKKKGRRDQAGLSDVR
jgi:uncharacterized protein with GYD domain